MGRVKYNHKNQVHWKQCQGASKKVQSQSPIFYVMKKEPSLPGQEIPQMVQKQPRLKLYQEHAHNNCQVFIQLLRYSDILKCRIIISNGWKILFLMEEKNFQLDNVLTELSLERMLLHVYEWIQKCSLGKWVSSMYFQGYNYM